MQILKVFIVWIVEQLTACYFINVHYCIAELDKQTTCELAKATAAALRLRVKERRSLASVIQFLHNPNAILTLIE